MRRNLKFYRKNEQEVMKRIGFRPTKNSGAGWVEKEDGISDHCICQLKSTDRESISIKLVDLNTLLYNASVSHKIPVFAVQFLKTDDIWIMVKPEDIPLIQDIVSGEYKNITENLDFCIDDETEKCYNIPCRDRSESSKARLKYKKMREKEMEERKREMKNKRR